LDLFAAASPHERDWNATAHEWGLYERRNSAFANLSGGERQRLFVALALISNPELVFLDEMTTGLDPAARRIAWSLIKTVRDRGATIVLVTHFMDEVETLCDRVAVFKNGRIVAIDSPHGIVERYSAERTVRFSAELEDLAWLSKIPTVHAVKRQGRNVEVSGEGAVLVHVAAAMMGRGLEPADLRVEVPTLEDAYIGLVKDEDA
jgi:ABC-2 type transport system ATP-binding protein